MRRTGLILLLVTALAAGVRAGAGASAPAGDPLASSIQENTGKLAALRDQIAAQRARMSALDDREADVKRSVAEIEQEIEDTARLLGEMDRRERELLAQHDSLAARVDSSRVVFAARREALGRNLRTLYMRGPTDEARTLMTAGSLSELLARVKLARMVARLEAGLVEQTRQQGSLLVREQKVLDSALAEIWQTRSEVDGQSTRLQELAAEKTAALRELQTERKDVKNRLMELNLNEQKLGYVLEDLEQQRAQRQARPDSGALAAPATGELAANAGRLEWPVQGELLRPFGRSVHPRFKTVTLNNGINIGAPAGTPVAAVAGGTVEFSDRLPGFGQCVILDHGDGYYTLYAHLAQVYVAKGAAVARGQVIAEVGRPGPGEDAQLYFEVRHGRTPLDPADWLRSR
ncbi:MAG TPA: peptidoglycan DD-metalloendopeptidase family protein [Candidatus Krumholzibacteria bacterium]|nr:peptidoglycan DD-metalloendopeptidase family protein [Candidatus Krumholzibacteria bacterium]